MKQNSSELVFILDMSGSMGGLESDTIGGFNGMIERQKALPGEATVTTVLFDDQYVLLHDRIDLRDVPKMTNDDYFPRGCTALLDAVGRTIQNITAARSRMKEEDIPEKTMVVITTDGLENASEEYTYESVKRLIDARTAEGWDFMFMAANIDAAKEGSKFGVSRDCSFQYAADEEGLNECYDRICMCVEECRMSSFKGDEWSPEDDTEED